MMQNNEQSTPEDKEYDARLRKRLELLKKELEAGKIQINPGLKVIDSLKAVRFGSDGEIDLSTVDGLVRSMALAVEGFHQRQETKELASLLDLQRSYFTFVETNFRELYQDMRKARATPFQVGSAISRDPEGVRVFKKAIPDILSWVEDLWKQAHDIAHIHAEDLRGLKGIFGGETFPQGYKNIVSCTGIYIDTNILPDPFLRSKLVLESPDHATAVRTLITSALSVLQYKEAALAEINAPLVAIVPDLVWVDQYTRQQVNAAAKSDAVLHLNAMFGTTFSALSEAEDFLDALDTTDAVTARLVDRSKLVFDVDDNEPLETQIERYIRDYLKPNGYDMAPGKAVMVSTIGRMGQANDLLFRSTRLGGSPITDAPTSWRYFNWKLGYGTGDYDPEAHVTLHMTKALQNAASGEMEWLGAVPIESLIEMRKHDVLPELRSMLSSGVKELLDIRPDNFFRTSDKVVENIQKAFDEHRKKLSALTGKRWRFAGVELGSCVVKGAVQVASACGVPIVSLVNAALDQVVDVPKLKDIPDRLRALRDETRRLRGSAVGMLFQLSANRRLPSGG